MVSGSCALPPRWPPQCSCVVIESSFDPGERLQAPGSLWFGRDHQTQIWFSGFRGEDLNVIFYQNMPNLHNRYKSAERNISQKNLEYMLNYSLPCQMSSNFNCSYMARSSLTYIPGFSVKFSFQPIYTDYAN
jgi:hypothetical protein